MGQEKKLSGCIYKHREKTLFHLLKKSTETHPVHSAQVLSA